MTMPTIVETLNYVKRFSGSTIMIKLGGSILNDRRLIAELCDDLSLLRAAGIGLVIVHGGSKAINQELELHKLNWEFHQGQRITTPEMIDIIEMVLCGHVNKTLVRHLNAVGVAAIGLSGCDHRMLQCSRFDPILQEVGKVDAVDTSLIEQCLQDQTQRLLGHIPVIAPIGVDDAGRALNINADWATTRIAQALNIKKMIYLTDQDGIYNQSGELYSTLNVSELSELIDNGIAKDGMMTKVKTIIDALQQGINHIHIINARKSHSLIEELFSDSGIGTVCTTRSN